MTCTRGDSRAARRLDTLKETNGRFRLNVALPIPFDGFGTLEVDLLCADARVAIELDGGQHLADPVAYRRDRRKDQLLQENGYFVLRFLAEDVGKDLDAVLDAILRVLAPEAIFSQIIGLQATLSIWNSRGSRPIPARWAEFRVFAVFGFQWQLSLPSWPKGRQQKASSRCIQTSKLTTSARHSSLRPKPCANERCPSPPANEVPDRQRCFASAGRSPTTGRS